MALSTKIRHIDKRPNGVLRFRRRLPKDVAEVLGASFLHVHIRNREGLAFHTEYQAIMRDFDRIVSETQAKLEGNDNRSPIEKWHDALIKAEGLVNETTGLEDDTRFARHLIAAGLAQRSNADPLLPKALANPEADSPKMTLQDAKDMYAKDKRLPENEIVRLDRITRRLEEAVGSLDKLPLDELRRDHGRRYMDLMLRTTKFDGQPLSIATCTRESKIVAAMVNHALREGDLQTDVSNPFVGLPRPKDAAPTVGKKLPQPVELIARV
ncbi:MAG: hypothetical protein AAGI28_16795 [Pseudomonadota bacterium]